VIRALIARAAPWALIGALMIAGLQTYRLALEQGAHAGTLRQHAEQVRKQEQQAREAVTKARAEDARRYANLMEIATNAQTELERARADAAGAADAAVRLRQRIAALAAARCPAPGNTSPSGSSAPADPAGDLLADVQRRLDDAASDLAGFADRARTAGAACERSYDALTERGPDAAGLP